MSFLDSAGALCHFTVKFGLDSVVEVGAAAFVVLWQFLGVAEERERLPLRLVE